MAANSTALHLLKLLLQTLDGCVCALQILVETITLANELLLPLSETVLLNLDLLGESLSERLFLLLELGVVELSGSGLTKFAGLHLLSSVGFVVRFFGGVDEIEHVSSDENGSELLEIAMVLVLDLGNSPAVLASLDDTSIGSLDILLGTDHGEWHGSHERACVLSSGLIILLNGWGVDLDTLSLNDCSDLLKAY
jgi:hypothetical protein